MPHRAGAHPVFLVVFPKDVPRAEGGYVEFLELQTVEKNLAVRAGGRQEDLGHRFVPRGDALCLGVEVDRVQEDGTERQGGDAWRRASGFPTSISSETRVEADPTGAMVLFAAGYRPSSAWWSRISSTFGSHAAWAAASLLWSTSTSLEASSARSLPASMSSRKTRFFRSMPASWNSQRASVRRLKSSRGMFINGTFGSPFETAPLDQAKSTEDAIESRSEASFPRKTPAGLPERAASADRFEERVQRCAGLSHVQLLCLCLKRRAGSTRLVMNRSRFFSWPCWLARKAR